MSGKWKTTEQAAMARRLLRSVDSGILSTMSMEIPGYPFGSLTPYAMTHEGRVAVYVSEIAQHTRNMRGDPKVCLTVTEGSGTENQQALGRVTVVGDAREVPADLKVVVGERYFSLFPEAREYAGTHDFLFYWVEPRRVRYIGGFGRIFWVEAEDWIVPTPAWGTDEQSIIEHMNTDHADAVVNIARQHEAREARRAELVSLDAEGFHLRADSTLLYIPFPAPCMTKGEIRAGMVRLARDSAAAS
jgi:putative heme iron utilization protein